MLNEELIEKIKSLPPERIAEVEDFVDFIAQRDERRLGRVDHTSLQMSLPLIIG